MVVFRLTASETRKTDSAGEKDPPSEDSDTNAMATPLPYSTEQERYKLSEKYYSNFIITIFNKKTTKTFC